MWRLFGSWALTLATGLVLSGCDDSDVGRCCEVIGADPSLIPVSDQTPEGDFINDVARDPAFDCNGLTCVAFRGSEAYCTEACDEDDDCPEGFSCAAIVRSEPPPGSNIGPEDRFCVRLADNIQCE